MHSGIDMGINTERLRTTNGGAVGIIMGLPIIILDALDECGSDSSQSAQR